MARITVRQQGALSQSSRDWPLFYMNDFSRFGLLVQDLHRAGALLQEAGYSIESGEQELSISARGDVALEIMQMMTLLQRQGIGVDTADLVGCVYQG